MLTDRTRLLVDQAEPAKAAVKAALKKAKKKPAKKKPIAGKKK